MRKPQRQVTARGHWSSLTDEQLLAVRLETDDPEKLEGLVREVPINDAEPHVEFSYNFRDSDREPLQCVHRRHRHYAGFVMNKGGARFLVGRFCGKKLYNEDWFRYKKDFDTAVERQDVARRLREMRESAGAFIAWVEALPNQKVFHQYEQFRGQFLHRMEWLFRKLAEAAAFGRILQKVKVPGTLFFDRTDPRSACARTASELGWRVMTLVAKKEQDSKTRDQFARIRESLKQLEDVIDQLQEVIDFFQPAVLEPVCGFATERHNPLVRRYRAGLMKISIMEGEKEVAQVQLPTDYQIPDRSMVQKFRLTIIENTPENGSSVTSGE